MKREENRIMEFIREARMTDLPELTEVEGICFPEAEAADREAFAGRLEYFPDHFWIMDDGNGKILSYVNGLVTDIPNLTDDMYAHPEMHNPDGSWQMIFGVATRPEFRDRGYAETLMNRALGDSHGQNRKGLVLTCKEELIFFYTRFGFVDEGICPSNHGGVEWHQLRRTF